MKRQSIKMRNNFEIYMSKSIGGIYGLYNAKQAGQGFLSISERV